MKKHLLFLAFFFLTTSLSAQKLELIKDFNTDKATGQDESIYNITTTSNSGYLYFVSSNKQYSLINRTKNGETAELISLDIPFQYVEELKAIQTKIYILTRSNLFIYDEILDSLYEFSSILPANSNFFRIHPYEGFNSKLNRCIYTNTGIIILSTKLNSYDMQLWKSDGTTTGTTLLKTLPNFLNNGDFNGMLNIDNILYMQFNELYLYDLTTNTYTSKNVKIIQPLIKDNKLYFYGKDDTYGDELWKSDGTSIGTEVVYDIYPGNIDSRIENVKVIDSNFFFIARHPSFGYEPWISNGSATGTRMLKDLTSGNNFNNSLNFNIVKCRNKYYFIKDDAIYKADLSLDSNSIVKLFIQNIGVSPKHLFVMNDTVYFSLYKNNIGRKFYKYTGINPVIQVSDINPSGGDVTEESEIYNLNNFFVFVYGDNILAKSNGTISGSKLIVRPINAMYTTKVYDYIISENNFYCFVKGSPSGFSDRILLLNINSSDTAQLINHWTYSYSSISTYKYIDIIKNNHATIEGFYFIHNEFNFESKMWYYNTLNNSTSLVADPLEYLTGPTSFNNFHIIDDNLLFTINNKLYTSNGKKNNVQLLKDSVYSSFESILYFQKQCYFQYDNYIFKTNGTKQGTIKAFDFGFSSGIHSLEMVQFDTSIAILVKNGNTRYLYLSDGTQQGTHLIKSFVEQQNTYSKVSDLFVFNNALYFKLSTDNNTTTELWKSDGTSLGTFLLKSLDINSSGISLSPTIFNGKFYFNGKITNSSIPYTTIIVSDGTTLGTVPFVKINNLNTDIPCSNFKVVGNKMFFVADINFNKQLFYTNGTSTTIVMDVNPIQYASYEYSSFTSFNDKLYFLGYKDETGYELWKSDGTALGTKLIKEFIPGPGSGVNSGLVQFDSKLYFSGYSPKFGYELWSINKNNEIKFEYDIAKGILSSNVTNVNTFNDSTLIFTANHALYSNELFSFMPNKVDAEIILARTCNDPEFRFNVQLANPSDSIASYQWDFGHSLTSNVKEPIVQVQTDTLNCHVKIVTTSGLQDTLYYTYINHHKIYSSFHINNIKQCLQGNKFTFTDKSTKGDSVKFYSRKWDLGDGTIIFNDSIFVHNYKLVGNYLVKLELTDDRGCVTKVNNLVYVNKNTSVMFNGNDSVIGDSTYIYTLPHVLGNTYFWSVPDGNGLIVGSNTSNEVKIKWKPVNGNSVLRLSTTDSNSCTVILMDTVNISYVVGMNRDEYLNTALKIMPNPSNEFIYLKSSTEISTYKIYDQTGRVILNNSYNQDKIDISFISPGIYIMQVDYVGGRQEFEKLMIK